MSPAEYTKQVKDSLYPTVTGTLNTGIVGESEKLLSESYDLISTKMMEKYKDMTPEAVEYFLFFEGFIIAFLEHLNNFDLVKDSFRNEIYN